MRDFLDALKRAAKTSSPPDGRGLKPASGFDYDTHRRIDVPPGHGYERGLRRRDTVAAIHGHRAIDVFQETMPAFGDGLAEACAPSAFTAATA